MRDTNYDHVRRQKKTYLVVEAPYGVYRLRRWKHQTWPGDHWEIPVTKTLGGLYNVRPPSDVCWLTKAPVTSSL